MNNVELIGRITHDPELKHGENASRTQFQMAINEVYYDSDGNKQEKTNFPRVIAWRKTAENICEYLSKGDRLAITDGKIVTDRWEDEETGNTRTSTKVQANRVEFLGSGNGGGSSKDAPKQESGKPGTPNNSSVDDDVPDDDDIPF